VSLLDLPPSDVAAQQSGLHEIVGLLEVAAEEDGGPHEPPPPGARVIGEVSVLVQLSSELSLLLTRRDGGDSRFHQDSDRCRLVPAEWSETAKLSSQVQARHSATTAVHYSHAAITKGGSRTGTQAPVKMTEASGRRALRTTFGSRDGRRVSSAGDVKNGTPATTKAPIHSLPKPAPDL